MRKSEKPIVIERLFELKWDSARRKFRESVVYKDEIQDAIKWCRKHKGIKLSPGNPPNFLKDIIRGYRGSDKWPQRLKDLRITAQQRMGEGAVFEFVPYREDQIEPFPNPLVYNPENTRRISVQSLSVPAVTKKLGRSDETYLIQVAIRLAIIETHFALHSPLADSISEIHHLQVGLKLRKTEIDTMFLATLREESGEIPVLITAEAKGERQHILVDQIVRQVHGALNAVKDIECVLPVAISAVDAGIYVVEFERIYRSALKDLEDLVPVAKGHYKLVPPLPGIAYRPAPRAKAATKSTENEESSRSKRSRLGK